MKSEATAAAEFKGKQIMHDPFSMRPFFGYNFGDYIRSGNQILKLVKILSESEVLTCSKENKQGLLTLPAYRDI